MGKARAQEKFRKKHLVYGELDSIDFPSLTPYQKIIYRLQALCSVDYRSLALMRISLGGLILGNLFWRAQDLVVHYTDFGLLPRGPFIENFMNPLNVSIYMITGTSWGVGILMGLQALIALAFMMGYRTRLMTVLSWFFLVSIQNRNPMILNNGDVLFRLTLFWAMFLPMGAMYSIDRALAPKESYPRSKTIFSAATVAIMLQLASVYVFVFFHKSGKEWWPEGTAVFYALNIDQLTTHFGQWLLQFKVLLVPVTWATIWFQIVAPILLFFPFYTFYARCFALLGLFGMQASFYLCMVLGAFPWISTIATFPFIPTKIWDWIELKLSHRREQAQKVVVYFDDNCAFCAKAARIFLQSLFYSPDILIPASTSAAIHNSMQTHKSWIVEDPNSARHYGFYGFATLVKYSPVFWWLDRLVHSRVVTAFGQFIYRNISTRRPALSEATSFLKFRPLSTTSHPMTNMVVTWLAVYVLFWNLGTLHKVPYKMKESTKKLGYLLRLDQVWNMFSPYPMTDDGWYTIPAVLGDGSRVDLFQANRQPTEEKPDVVSLYPNAQWQKYMMNIWRKDYNRYRLYFGKYLCRQFNQGKRQGDATAIKSFDIIYMREDTLPTGPATPVPVRIWQHRCWE